MTKCDIILERVTMEQVLEYYGIEKKKTNYKCPFHRDKNPSATITKNGRWFKCFGCGKVFNVIDFVCNYDNCTRKEAIQKLNIIFNLNLDNVITEQQIQEIKEEKRKRELAKAKKLQKEKDTWLALNEIASALRIWENLESSLLLKWNDNNIDLDKKMDIIYFCAKQQRWLNWLYDKITSSVHSMCEYDIIYQDKTSYDIIKDILNNKIVI